MTKKHLHSEAKIFTRDGDHFITFAILKAHSKKYSKLDILHMDAHADL